MRDATRHLDVEYWLSAGITLVLFGDEGDALLGPNRLVALAATSHAVAGELFAAVLSGYPDGIARSAGWIVRQQQWAVETAAETGATIEVHGGVMTRRVEAFPAPYFPNGLFG